MFKIGQKVVCVNAKLTILQLGKIYEIDGFHPTGNGVYLKGIFEDGIIEDHRVAYFIHRFRPADDEWAASILENIFSEELELELV